MPPSALVGQLLAAGLAEDFAAVASLPGAGNHAQVLRFSSSLRGEGRSAIDAMTQAERTAFIKALAIYEDTVKGLGSVTALCQLLPLSQDEDEATIDWVLARTRSYAFYANGARSLAEVLGAKAARAAGRAATARVEAERERAAKEKRAARATALLYNAVRRGDLNAVQGLMTQGASADARTPEGEDVESYAERSGRSEIAAVLRQARNQR
jgi:hypothetical protein